MLYLWLDSECLCFCTKSLKDMKKLIILTFYCRHFYCIFLFLLRFVIINTFKKKTIEMKQSILDLCFLRSHRNCFFFKKVVHKNFAKFPGKHLYQSLFFNKFAGETPSTFMNKKTWHRCCAINFAKFLKTPFSVNP